MNTAATQESSRPAAVENAAPAPRAVRTRTPHVDVVETPDAFMVRADVPGVSMDAVEVTVEAGRMVLAAKRPQTPREGFEAVLGAQRPGDYQRSFRIPRDIAHDGIRAELRDGVLTVTLPKASPDRAKKIAVQAG